MKTCVRLESHRKPNGGWSLPYPRTVWPQRRAATAADRDVEFVRDQVPKDARYIANPICP